MIMHIVHILAASVSQPHSDLHLIYSTVAMMIRWLPGAYPRHWHMGYDINSIYGQVNQMTIESLLPLKSWTIDFLHSVVSLWPYYALNFIVSLKWAMVVMWLGERVPHDQLLSKLMIMHCIRLPPDMLTKHFMRTTCRCNHSKDCHNETIIIHGICLS